MNNEAVIGTKGNGRRVYVWWLTESGKLRWFLLTVMTLFIFFYWTVPAMNPPITQIATAHEIYLPPNHWLVADVKNILTSEYGGRAIALLQVEARSIEEFRKKTENIYVKQYMMIDTWPGNKGNYVKVDYYAKNETSTEVIHASTSIASPAANSWGTYNAEGMMRFENGKLIVPRTFSYYSGTVHVIVLLAAALAAAMLIPNLLITLGLRKIYKSYLKP